MPNFKDQMSNKAFIANRKIFRGFTLVEMLVVFALIGTLTVAGISAFVSYNSSQTFRSTVTDVVHTLNFLRSRAMSQVKPPECGSAPLDGYQFWFPSTGEYYRLSVRCGGIYHVLERKHLPEKILFDDALSTNITFFKVLTGTVDTPSTIVLSGYGKTSTITVENTGVISAQE